MNRWLAALPQFLILLPFAASCYYTMKNQMRHTPFKTAALCTAVLLPYAFLCSFLCAMLRVDANVILLPSLILFFFLYRRTVTASLSKCLAVYVGVPYRPSLRSLPMPLTLTCTHCRALQISPWKRLFSGLGFPAWSQPLSHGRPADIFSGWLTA